MKRATNKSVVKQAVLASGHTIAAIAARNTSLFKEHWMAAVAVYYLENLNSHDLFLKPLIKKTPPGVQMLADNTPWKDTLSMMKGVHYTLTNTGERMFGDVCSIAARSFDEEFFRVLARELPKIHRSRNRQRADNPREQLLWFFQHHGKVPISLDQFIAWAPKREKDWDPAQLRRLCAELRIPLAKGRPGRPRKN